MSSSASQSPTEPPGGGGLRVKTFSQYSTHEISGNTANAVTPVVLRAQGHTEAVTGLMVGFGVVGYTGIIEQGIDHQ